MDFLWIIAKRRFSGNGAPHKSRAGSRGKMGKTLKLIVA